MSAVISRSYDENVSLTDSWYGKKIRAYLNAYGTKYDFCRLYSSESGGNILTYNGTITADGDFESDELSGFISILNPTTVEVPNGQALKLDKSYKASKIILFKASKNFNDIKLNGVKQNILLDKIFPILNESFGITEYESWYVDISHRIRHGVSDIFLFKTTTVTKVFDIDNFVYLSYIATAKCDRGRGNAGKLLHMLCGEYIKQGKSVYLYAREERRSFYESIGFIPEKNEILYEKDV